MKKISFLLIVTLVFTMFSVVSYAADEISFSVRYDAQSGQVSLRGTAYGIVTVRVAEADAADFSDDNLPVDYHQFNSNGAFIDEFYLPSGSADGKYDILITASGKSGTKTLVTYSQTDADRIVSNQISSASSSSEFVSDISGNAEALGIDVSDSDYSEAALELMYALDEDYANSSELYNSYLLCMAITSLQDKDEAGVLAKLRQYDTFLNIDVDNDFENNENLNDTSKSTLLQRLASLDYSAVVEEAEDITDETDFKAVYLAESALSNITNTESWQELRDIYNTKFPFLKENIADKNSDYKNATASSVFEELANFDFDEISDLKTNFDEAVYNVVNYQSNKNNSSSSGGGGGGGGGWSAPSSSGASTSFDEAPGFVEKIKTELTVPNLSGVKASYTDVAEGAWYTDSVTILGGSGIINGDPNGTFRPDDSITRAEFAKLIVAAFNIKAEKSGFSDVAGDSWYEPYVTVASGAGIIQGYDGKFSPNDKITRQDAAVIIYRVAALAGLEYTGYKEPSDLNTASVYAWPAIVTLFHNGVISGVGADMFMPLSNISRAQAAQLIYNTINNMNSR